ncbi:MAG TPA: membrane protein insertion efficiency factor YidD [Terriglobia bacterium]|nr:membrane protein insertion efficiency factor YidD [Terriglobia bacterium]HVB28508.1 membrane protein insertion efficiency factor YidD [Terriglobia bacterium]
MLDPGDAAVVSSRAPEGAPWARKSARFATLTSIRFYKVFFSPLLFSSCRYYPTCSEYAYQAIEKWGVRKGLRLAMRRLARCRPLGGGGIDLVP